MKSIIANLKNFDYPTGNEESLWIFFYNTHIIEKRSWVMKSGEHQHLTLMTTQKKCSSSLKGSIVEFPLKANF